MSRHIDIIDVRQIKTPREIRMAVIEEVAERHGVPLRHVLSRRRDRHIVAARHAAIRELRERFDGDSLPNIARLFNRDHTSIVHALRKKAR